MIVVLTYNYPHRKTQDVILKLLAHGVKPVVVATEWEERRNFEPIISHRPAGAMQIPLKEMVCNLGLNILLTTKQNLLAALKDLGEVDFILLATGNIVDEEVVTQYRVINSHPGYLPKIKGLDALKWAILYEEPIGVTTHFVNEQVDGGVIIQRNIVPLYYEDSFHNLAYRQYEMEVEMLIHALTVKPENIEIGESEYPTFRRMPHRLEYRMLKAFEERKDKINLRV